MFSPHVSFADQITPAPTISESDFIKFILGNKKPIIVTSNESVVTSTYTPTPTPTPTPDVLSSTNVHLTPEAKEDLQILQQLKDNKKLNYTQDLLMFMALMIPVIPLTWRIHLAQFVSTLPVPGMSPFLFTTIIIFWPLISLVLLLIFLALVFVIIRGTIRTGIPFIFRRFIKDTTEKVFLELTFPSDTVKSSYATEQLYRLLHTLARHRKRTDDLTKRKKTYSLEVVAQRSKGIRFVIQVVKDEAEIVKRNLLSYLPGIKVREISDYISDSLIDTQTVGLAELKLQSHHALPLCSQKVLTEHDPMSYLTGNMTNLKNGELVVFQVVMTPLLNSIHYNILNKHRQYRYLITQGKPLRPHLQQNAVTEFLSIPGIHEIYIILKYTVIFLFQTIRFTINFAFDVMMASSSKSGQAAIAPPPPPPVQQILNPIEQEVQTIVKEKLDQHMFETSIRLLVAGSDADDLTIRLEGLVSAFGQMSSNNQSLGTKHTLPFMPQNIITKKRFMQLKQRVLSPDRVFNQNPILSTSEISDLYHFPYTDTTKTEDLAKIYAPELPTPLSLKRPEELSIIFAKNTYGSDEVMIGLTREERKRHMAIFGATGVGKSTLLAKMIQEDILNNEGVCLIDPHGDLADEILSFVPKERKQDVIWFDPDNLEREIALNLLELTPNLGELEGMREKEYICESIISLFRTVFSDAWSNSGNPHQIEYILRNTIYTAFTVKDCTLFTIYDLLTNKNFRDDITKKLINKRLRQFWKEEFGQAGAMQRVKMMRGVTARIGRFLFSPSASQILDKPKSTINFDEILDNKKILICKVPMGELGDDTAQLLGMLVLHKIQLAALKRARKKKEERNDYYVYVDEFQNFANLSFMKMLSQTRKYGVNLIAAEQTTAQQRDRMLSNLLIANTGTLGAFKLTTPQDTELLLPQFSPYIKKGRL